MHWCHCREETYTFNVVDSKVLHGLREGVLGMCVGERRRIRIPPELAVGDINEGLRLVQSQRLLVLVRESRQ